MRGTVVCGVLLAALTLAACNDEPEPRFGEPTESPSTSKSTSSAAAEPEPWEEKSKAGAVAFVGLWVDTFSEALLSGETADLRDISAERCVTCRNFIQRIDDVYSRGGFYKEGAWSVVATDVAPGGTEARRSIILRVNRDAERYRESRSGPLKTFPRSNATFTVDVEWSDSSWRMSRMQLFS